MFRHVPLVALSLALLGQLTTRSKPVFASECDNQAQSVMSISRIIESSLKRGDLTLEDLQSVLSERHQINPFLGLTKTIENIAAARSIQRTTQNFDAAQRNDLRWQIQLIVQRAQSQQPHIQNAQEETAQILALRDATHEFNLDLEQNGAPPESVTIDGRTLIAGQFTRYEVSSAYVLDFGKSPENVVSLLRTNDLLEFSSFEGSAFSWKGKPYYATSDGLPIFDLTTNETATFIKRPSTLLPDGFENLDLLAIKIFPTAHRLQFLAAYQGKRSSYSSGHSRKVDGRLGAVDLSSKKPKFKTFFPKNVSAQFSLQPTNVAGRVVLPVIEDSHFNKLYFYDVTEEPHLLTTIHVASGQRFEPQSIHVAHWVQFGDWYVITTYKTRTGNSHLGIFDFKTGKFVRAISLGRNSLRSLTSIDFVMSDMTPVLLVNSSDSFIAVDLATQKILWTAGPANAASKPFTWKGDQYVLLATDNQGRKLELRRVSDGASIGSKSLPVSNAQRIQIIEANDERLVFISGGGDSVPAIFRLTARDHD